MYYVKFLILILCALALMNKSYGASQKKNGYPKLPNLTSNSSIRKPLVANGKEMDSTSGQKSQKSDIQAESDIEKKIFKGSSSNSKNSKPIMPLADFHSRALEIYQNYGVHNNSWKLCKSIDGKSSIIYGYGICKEAAEQLNLASQDDRMTVRCEWVPMNEKYKHLSKFQFDKFLVPSLLMVKCYKWVELHKYTFLFHLAHAKEHIYYIFDTKPKPDIDAVVKIDPPNDNSRYYPMIPTVKNIEETRNLRDADNIFIHIGYASSKDKDHVCQKSSNGSLNGEEMCKKALKKHRHGAKLTKSVVCETRNVRRFRPEDKSFGWPKYKKNIQMARCDYFYCGQNKTMYIFNVAVEDYYFVLEPNNYFERKGKKLEPDYSDMELTAVYKLN